MRIYVTSVFVDDQAKALNFYTEKLGFIVKHDIPLGDHRWLTVVSKEAPEGTELVLEPDAHPRRSTIQICACERWDSCSVLQSG
jgi:catechol 2,3-dioxygenase-like lactoylglutathione lyase family enzyme